MNKTLGDLKPGENGYISAVGGNDPRVKRRLTDMGITPLTKVYVRKTAPLGDPIEVHLRGYDLSLRRDDAIKIDVFSPDEAQIAIENERQRNVARLKKGSALLSRHELDDDSAAHEGAARLTEWVVTSQQDKISFPPPSANAAKSSGTKMKAAIQKSDNRPVKLALVGNPNSGKTTLFNALTGSREYVGNWPGVTVEKKEGRLNAHGHEMMLVDLPGIYSLSPYSMEEVIARNFIIHEKPDAIINIVDGTNLERNLYLTVQLMELERPLILAINMMDEVEKHGDSIDILKLSLELGVPVVPISAKTGEGVDELIHQCELLITLVHEQLHRGFGIEPDHVYDDYTHALHHGIGEILGDSAKNAGLPLHWAQIKLLEGDAIVRESLNLSDEQVRRLDKLLARYAGEDERFDNATRMADSRYRFITNVCAVSLKRKREGGVKSLSDKIDAILTNKYLALPIFLAIMLLIFMLTFGSVGAWLSDQVDMLFNGVFAPAIEALLLNAGTAGWLISLITEGVIAGVGGVLTFLPQIALLFICLSMLEDSGYLSRTAFIMDKLLRSFGLSGKSFIPMLMGFGCTVPATMGARAMDNDKDRRMTILLLPFMSCSAKLPVYGLISGAFFAEHQWLVVFSLYIMGIAVGFLTGLLFKRTLFKGQDAPFVMEMPPYRRPVLKNTLRHVNERVLHFLEKAGTIILLMSVVLWFFQSFDLSFNMVDDASSSMLARFGSLIAPAFTPLGFGAWQAVVALITGFVAKEAVVSSLSLLYGFSTLAGDTAVRATLSATFTPLSAYSFLVFVLLYVPCMAAVATMRKELGSAKLTLFMVAYQVLIAYAAALIIYQVGAIF